MKIRRLLALVLVVIVMFTLVGCPKKNKRQVVHVTLSTEDSEAILAAAGITLPDAEVALGAGTTVEWFAWYDPFQNYSESEIVNTGYFTFTEKYGGKIECNRNEHEIDYYLPDEWHNSVAVFGAGMQGNKAHLNALDAIVLKKEN